MIEEQTEYRKNAPLSIRGPAGKILVAVLALGVGGAEHRLFIDGVTAATKPAARPPTLAIGVPAGSPALAKDTIQIEEGQSVVIDLKVYDPRDTQNLYHDFKLEVSPPNFPPGATLGWNSLTGQGRYTWTPGPGDAQSYPHAALTFVATNTFLGGTTKHKINLAMGHIPPPAFDSSIPARKNAGIGEKLKFPLSVESAGSRVKIKARGLPPGALLGATRKDRGTGKWIATLAWKPKAKQAGFSRETTFTAVARDSHGNVQQATLSVTFTVGSAGFAIDQARWNASTSQLAASGTGTAGQPVTLSFGPSGPSITKVPIVVDGKGAWEYIGKVEPSNAPCAIQAQAGGETATLAVASAPSTCVATPNCPSPMQWYPENTSGMEGMCM